MNLESSHYIIILNAIIIVLADIAAIDVNISVTYSAPPPHVMYQAENLCLVHHSERQINICCKKHMC